PNRRLQWDSSLPGNGNGARSLGKELENSHQFAQCQVEKVFRTVCLRPPSDQADRNKVSTATISFINGNYRMKSVFAELATYCMGP
ncbi:MAG: hypothetical protein D6698_14505, partial [Gammaproteobacteria bacterium]